MILYTLLEKILNMFPFSLHVLYSISDISERSDEIAQVFTFSLILQSQLWMLVLLL